MRLLIRHVRTASGRRDLRVVGKRITEIGTGLAAGRRERLIDGDGLVALPGLINAHDHLSLNLLPHLGNPPYANVYAFASDVYRPDRPPIDPVQRKTAVADRLLWGGYKNLVSGVTTVVHHDPFSRRVLGRRFPVKVLRRYAWSHSLRFGPDPAAAYRRDRPFVIHAAEGIDKVASAEVDSLDALGVLAQNTVLVHAIAVDADQRRRLAQTGVGIVWCPASNLRLYGRTAEIPALTAAGIDVALGTDSTISGAPILLDEARAAASTGLVSPADILAMVTDRAARVFGLADGRGRLEAGSPADLILIPDRGDSLAAALLDAHPADIELVMTDGRPRLADGRLAEALDLGPANAQIDGRAKWLVGDFRGLRRRLVRAAGEAALATGALWPRLRSIPSGSGAEGGDAR